MRKLIPAAAKSFITVVLLLLSSGIVFTQQMNPAVFGGLRWRLIGPFRAGRVSAGAIDPDPNTYYIGTPGGGVWKTTDAGQVWSPIFDAVHVASIGAIAVSPSNPKIVYVGTGEQTPGNGVYKSTDAGATWSNVGLRDTHFIGEILLDPANPDVVLVAAIGDRNSGAERGVFKSTDGGRTWTKALFKDDAGGSASMVAALDNPKIVYATLAPAAAGRGAGAPLRQAQRRQGLDRRASRSTSRPIRATRGRRSAARVCRRRSRAVRRSPSRPGREGAASTPTCATACSDPTMAATRGSGGRPIRASPASASSPIRKTPTCST